MARGAALLGRSSSSLAGCFLILVAASASSLWCFIGQRGGTAAASPRAARYAEAKQEVVYNYFAQDYALVTRKERPFDLGEFLTELLPLSPGEVKARDLLDELLPGWQTKIVGPDNEQELRRRFRAISVAAGGDDFALSAMRKNVAIMYFSDIQLKAATAVLVDELGKEEAAAVIRKNPGALTIDPQSMKDNVASITFTANIVDAAVKNSDVSRTLVSGVGLFFAVSLSKALFDVINLRVLSAS
eukprot:TRINITY_DN61803_c0_g1_i1.p1 TRINITY_DN61803_c0_g1~~TRINITY_DN61803_c0_g1_i1.p1  ORF type:complete len:244 (-),score=38.82 TRINITY_DN61803_c0_g1_i1:186-917(-)